MERDLDGKTALVTGSGRNNGRAILLELAAKGANVIVNTRANASEAESVANEAKTLGVETLVAIGDVSKQETIDSIRAAAEERFGGIDISVSNANLRPFQKFLDMSIDDWLEQHDIQLNASFRLAKAVAPGMIERRWGRIIHITGPDAFSGLENRAHNVAAKGGLRGLTKALAMELGPYGITVNDVAPGIIDHPETRHLSHPIKSEPDEDLRLRLERDADWQRRRVEQIPVRRTGLPEDLAYACGFLASPRASYYTGTVMCCFGGRLMIP